MLGVLLEQRFTLLEQRFADNLLIFPREQNDRVRNRFMNERDRPEQVVAALFRREAADKADRRPAIEIVLVPEIAGAFRGRLGDLDRGVNCARLVAIAANEARTFGSVV